MTLDQLISGQTAFIVKVRGRGVFRKRLMDMGFIRGQSVTAIRTAPLKDPIEFHLMDYNITLRRAEAELIEIQTNPPEQYSAHSPSATEPAASPPFSDTPSAFTEKKMMIDVALVGNPNSGKTSIFNLASKSREHVGNYAGVTIESKKAQLRQDNYLFNLTDLPGTYSLTAFSPEELYVREYLRDTCPDVVLNVIDASNLERNLYLTTQLIDMDVQMVIALNMYDELEKDGKRFDYEKFGLLLGVPVIPTVGISGSGVRELFTRISEVYEGREKTSRHIHIPYQDDIEQSLKKIQDEIWKLEGFTNRISSRFVAIKLLEKDTEIQQVIGKLGDPTHLLETARQEVIHLERLLGEDTETLLTNARYGFIHGALRETYKKPKRLSSILSGTMKLDRLLTHKILGFPFFLLFLWIMFQSTFNLGKFPVAWIEAGVTYLSVFLDQLLAAGWAKDLLVDGIVGGVGGVIVFLPNIVILFFFISLMEDTGYMARVAFIMDKLMHLIGLHGKSFIPLIMGFGCNVPAIMATRTIENRSDRMVTMLILPFMSCSARLPVYILIAGVVFPDSAANMIFLLYLIGILLSITLAILLKKSIFKSMEAPFVMELPPYRPPRGSAVFKHMWFRSQMYLKKMGGVILAASMIIWALGYFPRHEGSKTEQLQESFIGKIGQSLEPVMSPLGFDWRMTVGLFTGIAAKEVVISTLGVIYPGEDPEEPLTERLKEARHSTGKKAGTLVFTPAAGFSFLLFVLIYIPCVAVLAAIRRESGGWKWALFMIFYTTALAWLIAFAGYHVASLF